MVLGTADLERMTPLHCAAMYDHADLVQYLITEVSTSSFSIISKALYL